MWLNGSDDYLDGRRYSLSEITALVYPLDMLLDWLRDSGPKDVFDERLLWAMDADEALESRASQRNKA